MRLTFKLTAGDFTAAQHLILRRNLIGLPLFVISYFAVPLFGAMLTLGYISSKGMSGLHSLRLILALFITLTPLWLDLSFRYRFKASGTGNASSIFEFGEERIAATLPGRAQSDIEWAEVTKFQQGKKVILIYTARTPVLIVPKRVLTGNEAAELIGLLQRKLSAHAR